MTDGHPEMTGEQSGQIEEILDLADEEREAAAADRAEAALDRLAGAPGWLNCTSPPHSTCTDAACPVHGDADLSTWVTCGNCLTLIPAGEPCPHCKDQR
jgi:hypothetical protein